MGGSDSKGDGLASQPRRYRVPGQPLLNWHQVGGVSRSPDGLFAQQEREPIRGRPTVRGKSTYGGRPGQRVEEQGTWAARKHSEAGYGRPVDRGVWTAKTVKQPRQQPAHPQYANYWALLTRKQHTMPHSAQSQHTNYWAPQTRKRHQQEHRPQRPTESSDLTQHAKGRTGDRPGPRKGATTRRNVTQGVGQPWTCPWVDVHVYCWLSQYGHGCYGRDRTGRDDHGRDRGGGRGGPRETNPPPPVLLTTLHPGASWALDAGVPFEHRHAAGSTACTVVVLDPQACTTVMQGRHFGITMVPVMRRAGSAGMHRGDPGAPFRHHHGASHAACWIRRHAPPWCHVGQNAPTWY